MAGVPRMVAHQTRKLGDPLTAHLQFRLMIIISRLWEAARVWVQISHGRPLLTPQDLKLGPQDEHTPLNFLGRLLPLGFRQTPGPCRMSTY